MRLQLNQPENFAVEVRRIGEDKNPVIIVDNVLANALEVREFALGSRFSAGHEGDYYPGYMSACSLPGMTQLTRWVAEFAWRNVYQLEDAPFLDLKEVASSSFFAAFAPRMDGSFINVHVDSHSWLAVVLYLSPPAIESGTAFWRNKESALQSFIGGEDSLLGIQKVEALFGVNILDRLKQAYAMDPVVSMNEVRERLFASKKVSPPFSAESCDVWERLDHVSVKFNRMVVYPTWQFHSVAYPNYLPPKHLRDARLTLNTFVKYPLRKPESGLKIAAVEGIEL